MIRCKKDPKSILKFINWILSSGYKPNVYINSNNFKVRIPKILKFTGIVRFDYDPKAIEDLKIDSHHIEFKTYIDDDLFKVIIPLESLIDIRSDDNKDVSFEKMYSDSDAALDVVFDHSHKLKMPKLNCSSIFSYSRYIYFLTKKLENSRNYFEIYENLLSHVKENEISNFIRHKIRPSVIDLDDNIFKLEMHRLRLDLARIRLTFAYSEYERKLLEHNNYASKLVQEIINVYTEYQEYVEHKIKMTTFNLTLKFLIKSESISSKPSIADIICVFKNLLQILQNVYWRENTKDFIFQIERMKNSYIHHLLGNTGEVREANMLLNEIENRISTLAEVAY